MFSPFCFVLSVSTVFVMWKVEIALHPDYLPILVTELGIYISKCAPFISNHIQALATHEVNITWWTCPLAPHHLLSCP